MVHPDRVLTNSGARAGDILVLTKPLGAGILTTAAKADLLSEAECRAMAAVLAALNRAAAEAAVPLLPSACTDVTGFGLMGHLTEMAQGSGKEITLDTSAIDVIPEALEFAKMGLLPEGMYRNRSFAEAGVDVGDVPLYLQDALFDPQTAGGLVMAVDPADADALYNELKGCVPSAQRTGTVADWQGGKWIFLR